MSPPPPHLDAASVHRLLPFDTLVPALSAAFSLPPADPPFPARSHHPTGPEGDTLVMLAWDSDHIATKVIHVRRGNRSPLGSVQASVSLAHRGNGLPAATIDGHALTLRRTAAASALAARRVRFGRDGRHRLEMGGENDDLNEDAGDDEKDAGSGEGVRLLVVGTGALAPMLAAGHAWASRWTVREVLVAGRGPAGGEKGQSAAQRTASEIEAEAERCGVEIRATVVAQRPDGDDLSFGAGDEPDPAASTAPGTRAVPQVRVAYAPIGGPLFNAWVSGRADVISCATLAESPLIHWDILSSNRDVHVDLVGAYRRGMVEADAGTIKNARVFVDTRGGAAREAGDLIAAQESGNGFSIAEHVEGELSEVEAWRPSERGDGRITLFKSVGHAIEDIAAASLAFKAHQALQADLK